MFCPQCGAEYQEGIERCPNCNVALVAEAPPEATWAGLTTVFETSDPALAQVAATMLEVEAIPFFTRSTNAQDLLGDGGFSPGFSLVMGPMALQVPENSAAQARELLAPLAEEEAGTEMETAESDEPQGEEPESAA